jgi:hypothetical protein
MLRRILMRKAGVKSLASSDAGQVFASTRVCLQEQITPVVEVYSSSKLGDAMSVVVLALAYVGGLGTMALGVALLGVASFAGETTGNDGSFGQLATHAPLLGATVAAAGLAILVLASILHEIRKLRVHMQDYR